MRLVECDVNNAITSRNGFKATRNLNILTEFIESGMDCAKIEDYTQREARYCATSLNNSIKRYHMTGVRAVMLDHEVYLVKTDKIEEIHAGIKED